MNFGINSRRHPISHFRATLRAYGQPTFGKLSRAVNIIRPNNDSWDAEALEVSSHQHLSGSLAGRVRVRGMQRVCLNMITPARQDLPINLISRDMDEPLDTMQSCGFQEVMGTNDIGP